MYEISQLKGLEILDSRGRPTVQATCVLSTGARGVASVPSGASTGAAEVLELRDGDPNRYDGLGCRTAVSHIDTLLDDALSDHVFNSQHELDMAILELDGTPNKSHLGANAILAVSLAFARAVAAQTPRCRAECPQSSFGSDATRPAACRCRGRRPARAGVHRTANARSMAAPQGHAVATAPAERRADSW